MSIFGGEVLEFGTGLDFSGLDTDLGKIGGKVKKGLAPIGTVFKTALGIGAAVGGTVLAIGASAVKTGSDFEALESRLSTLLGSAEAGRARFAEVLEAASSTPFELGPLVEAEATLEAFGLSAPKWRDSVMDLSAALGIDLVQSAESIGRAFAGGAGAADVLRDRGVLTMIELREGVKATEMSTQDFRDALYATLSDEDGKIAGGAARLSQTFSGLVSNMQDEWSMFNKEVADAGSFAAVKEALKITLGLIEKNRSGVNSMAETISSGLVGALKFGIDAVAFFNEGWTLTKALVFGYMGALEQAKIAELDVALAAVDLARVLEQIPGIGDSIGAGLDDLEGFLIGKRAEVVGTLQEMDKEAAKIADNIGEAAAEAQAYKDRLDQAVSVARELRDTPLSPPPGSEPPKVPDDSGGKDESDKMDKLIRKQTLFVAGITTAGDKLAQLQLQERQSLLTLNDITQERLDLVGDNVKEQTRILEEFERDKLAIQEEYARRSVELQREQFHAAAENAHGFASTIIGSLSSISDVAFDETEGKAKEAALAVFRVQKGLRIAEIAIDTTRAAMAAFLPPPIGFGPAAGGVAAGFITAAGIASAATVAATQPKFHSGGFARYASPAPESDEIDARLTRREMVVDETQQRGILRALRAAGAGGGGAAQSSPQVVVRYRHREFNAVVRDNLRISDSPLSSALNGGRITSQR